MTKQLTPFYANFLRTLRKLPAPKSLGGQSVQSIIACVVILGAIFLLGTVSINDIVGSITPVALAILGGILLFIGAWLRPILDFRQSPAERRTREFRDQLALHLKKCEGSEEVYALKRVTFKKSELFTFPKPEDGELLQAVGKLNYEIFKYTPFGDSVQKKIDRNTSHLRKNPNSIMLLARPAPRITREAQGSHAWIGFTHLLPIDRRNYDRYLDKKIGDNDFSAQLVCRPDEAAYALIIFSIGIDRYKIKSLHSKEKNQGKIGRIRKSLVAFRSMLRPEGYLLESDVFLREALLFHLRKILKEQQWESTTVRVISQSLNEKVIRLLKEANFKALPEEMRSMDNEPMFELLLSNGSP